jgi:hypothetical protein
VYRYDNEDRRQSEKPLKEYDHALDALRYLITSIDTRRMSRLRLGPSKVEETGTSTPESGSQPKPRRKWNSLYNEALWTPFGTIWRDG